MVFTEHGGNDPSRLFVFTVLERKFHSRRGIESIAQTQTIWEDRLSSAGSLDTIYFMTHYSTSVYCFVTNSRLGIIPHQIRLETSHRLKMINATLHVCTEIDFLTTEAKIRKNDIQIPSNALASSYLNPSERGSAQSLGGGIGLLKHKTPVVDPRTR